MKTTHYVTETKNPQWDVSTEIIVSDFTHSLLYFILYDWDGTSPSEDDFLGSASLVLSKASSHFPLLLLLLLDVVMTCHVFMTFQNEPSVIRRSLTLGYNLVNVGQVENNSLGCVTVSVIFRPVTEVAIVGELNPIPIPVSTPPPL